MGHLIAKIPVAFAAGLLSVVTPCVLPLVPGYLSAVSAVDPSRLGEPRPARRVVLASLPFIFGFTVVFVILGAAAAAIGGVLNPDRQLEIAGLLLVVLGLAFAGLLPWPERMVAPGLITGARRHGSSFLLGGAFAVCAAPCIGTVLAGILVLAADSRTVIRGSLLLVAYSAGLGVAFLLAGVAFARAMTVFRWVRDHYLVIQRVSGTLLVALGLLLFFHRDWWLRVALNHALEAIGLGSI
jgi:cytochrome c-type biogenesis protein